MTDFLVLYYVAAALVGFVAITVSVLGAIHSRIVTYWLLIVLYAAHSLGIITLFLRNFLYATNDAGYDTVAATYAVATVLSVTVIVVALLYVHRMFAVAHRPPRDAAAVVAGVVIVAFYAFPGQVTVDHAAGTLSVGALARAGTLIYLVLFAYMLVVGIAGRKRDFALREHVLIWSVLAFGVVGFMESLFGAIDFVRNPAVELALGADGFSISTIPYLCLGAILIYYFGSYLLAERREPRRVAEQFAQKHRLSPREIEVVELMNRGLGNREIAEKLFVSLATVKTHAHNIYEKTGTRSRYELFHLSNSAT